MFTRTVFKCSSKNIIRNFSFMLFIVAPFYAFAQTSPYRYDDDLSRFITHSENASTYQRFKYLPLNEAGDVYASFGGDVRERVEMSDVSLLGFRYRGNDMYDLHRMLLHAYMVIKHFRFFAQVGSEFEVGRRPRSVPTDVDRGDLAQGFVDYNLQLSRSTATLRAGRFEMSFDQGALISLRDGPNVRQTWDGGWFIYRRVATELDVFAVRPVSVKTGWFDDYNIRGQSIWGIHIVTSPWKDVPVRLNSFYYDSVMSNVMFFPYSGRERTHTFGTRVQVNRGAIDGSIGGIIQTGRLTNHDVFAWGAHVDTGWTWRQLDWQPRIGLQGDALSGGSDRNGTIHTFNPLYPNYSFSTEATIEAPVNLIQAALVLGMHPITRFFLEYKWEALWRYSSHDAFYAAPVFALARPIYGAGDRFSGYEQQIRASLQINDFWGGSVAFVHFSPSEFLKHAHAVAETFGMFELSFKF